MPRQQSDIPDARLMQTKLQEALKSVHLFETAIGGAAMRGRPCPCPALPLAWHRWGQAVSDKRRIGWMRLLSLINHVRK